jgi:hypothetical protein
VRIINPPSPPFVDRGFQGFQSPLRPELSGEKPLEIDLDRPSTWGINPAHSSGRTSPPAGESGTPLESR